MRWVIVAMVMAAVAPAFGQQETDEIQELDVEQARKFAQQGGGLSIANPTTLSLEAAEILATHKGGMFLSGVATLTPGGGSYSGVIAPVSRSNVASRVRPGSVSTNRYCFSPGMSVPPCPRESACQT